MISIILISLAVLTLYVYSTKNYKHWTYQNVPSAPNPFPIFGHILPLFTLQDNLGTLLEKFYYRMGKNSMYGCYLMETPAVLIRDPELIKQVLKNNFDSFENNLISLNDDLDPILTKNPFFARGEVWKKSRAVMSINLGGKKLRCFLVFVKDVCDKLMTYVDDKVPSGKAEFETKDMFSRLVGEIVAESAFGVDGQCFKDELDSTAMIRVAEKVFQPNKIRCFIHNARFWLPGVADFFRISFMPKDMDNFVRHNVRNFINKQSELSNTDYLQFSMEDVETLDEDMLLSQATSLFFDGYLTISTVLSFLIYRIAENSLIQEKARREIRCMLEKYEGHEAFKNMTYLEQIFYETLRMHPSFGDMSRVCNKDITLRGYDGLECNLKPGDVVLMSVSRMNNDEEFWKNPETFDPERFVEVENRNSLLFLGFGQGPRICPARRMVILVIKTVLADILMKYRLKISERMKGALKVNSSVFVSSVEGGVWVKFKPLP